MKTVDTLFDLSHYVNFPPIQVLTIGKQLVLKYL
jgi:hypothetical protein